MRWIAKAAAFNVLSVLPGGESVYHFAQNHVLGTSRLTEDALLHRLGIARRYAEALDGADPADLHHVDVGAGWLPTVPFVFYGLGVERQTLLDVSRHMSLPPVRELAEAFRAHAGSLPEAARRRLPPEPAPEAALDDYLGSLGMRLVAPYSLDDLHGLEADVVTCTGVLLHIREDGIRALLAAVAGALRPGGLFLAYVPLHDVYARFDRSITPFNKWRYSRFVWERLVDSRLMQFNRLTAADYRRLIEEAGLEPVGLDVEPASPEEAAGLERVRLHPDFADRAPDELLPRSFVLVARR